MAALLPNTDEQVRADMHKALDQELDRELVSGSLRRLSVRIEVGVDTVLTAITQTERIPTNAEPSTDEQAHYCPKCRVPLSGVATVPLLYWCEQCVSEYTIIDGEPHPFTTRQRDRNGNVLVLGENFAWVQCFPDEPGRRGEFSIAKHIGGHGGTVIGEVVLQTGDYGLGDRIELPATKVVRW